MKNLIIVLLLLLFFSCRNDDIQVVCKSEIIDECVANEVITSNQTDFYLFNTGEQEFGISSGIKINEDWDASPFIWLDSFSFFFALKTYTLNDFNEYIQAETISILDIPSTNAKKCYALTSNMNNTNTDSLFIRYVVQDDDTTLARYDIDTTAENKLEILEFNPDTQKFRGKLKASFITNAPIDPIIPEKVRFFNVEIEIN